MVSSIKLLTAEIKIISNQVCFIIGRNVGDGVIFFYSQTSRMNHLLTTFQALAGIDSYKITLCHKGKTRCPKNFKVNLSDDSTYFERSAKSIVLLKRLNYNVKYELSHRYADLVTFQISQVTLEKGNYELVIECESLSSNVAGASCCNQSRIFEIFIAHQFPQVDIAIIVALILLFAFCILGAMALYLRQKILEPSIMFTDFFFYLTMSKKKPFFFLSLQFPTISECCWFLIQLASNTLNTSRRHEFFYVNC